MVGKQTERVPALYKRSWGQILRRDFQMNKYKYLLVIPVIVYLFIFAYKPMYGLIIAFKEYRPRQGISGSKWVGLKQFENFWNDPYRNRIIRNTFSISGLTILFGFPAPILLALLLNEIQNTKFKRTIQTVTYMPYFISMVVACSLIKIYCQQNGLFSQIAELFGGTRQNMLTNPNYFYPIYVISEIWQTIGWNSIIYLAALSSIDQEQYEAARIDGAGRFRQMLNITLPGLMPTITILFILRMGSILNVGFEKIILLYNDAIFEKADVISSYVYRRGLKAANPAYSYAAAVGLFNSVVNVLFLMVTNFISSKVSDTSLF